MGFKNKEDYNIWYKNKYLDAQENKTICEICGRKYNIFTKFNHNKSKHHLMSVEIFKLKIENDVMKDIINESVFEIN